MGLGRVWAAVAWQSSALFELVEAAGKAQAVEASFAARVALAFTPAELVEAALLQISVAARTLRRETVDALLDAVGDALSVPVAVHDDDRCAARRIGRRAAVACDVAKYFVRRFERLEIGLVVARALEPASDPTFAPDAPDATRTAVAAGSTTAHDRRNGSTPAGNGRWRILGAADDAKGQHEKPFHTARVIPLEVAVNEPASAARIPAKTGSRWTAKRRGGRLALCRLEDAAEAAPVRSP